METNDLKEEEFLEGDQLRITQTFEPGLKDVLKLLLGYPIKVTLSVTVAKLGRRYHRDPATNKRIETEFVRFGDEAVTVEITPETGFTA